MTTDANDTPATKSDVQRLLDAFSQRSDAVDRRFDAVDQRSDKLESNLGTVAHQVAVLTDDVAGLNTKMDAGFREVAAAMARQSELLSTELAQHADSIIGEVQKMVGVMQDKIVAVDARATQAMDGHIRDYHS